MRVAIPFSVPLALALASTVAVAEPPAPQTHRAASARPTPSRYRAYVDHWHSLEPGAQVTVDEQGRPKLVIVSLNTNDRVELSALTDRGGFAATDLDRAAFVLREPSSGNAHPVEPRLVDLVYRIQLEFSAPEIRVISGYRTPHGRNASNHGHGRAIDIVVPGAADADVAKFARELGFVGVGIYPTSGFVHVDVRDRSYFWVDSSAPGRRNSERGILRDLAIKSDAAAAARGEHGLAPFSIATDVDAALKDRRALPAAAPDGTDDDDMPSVGRAARGAGSPSDG
jgi:uncharacterized protein YcbK (DUF882 family)